jgi:cbb3-type cytochrome oxidase maturation protein
MDSLYLLIPIALLFCFIAIRLLLWAIGSGQYDDLDKEASRILMDEAPPAEAPPAEAPPAEAVPPAEDQQR